MCRTRHHHDSGAAAVEFALVLPLLILLLFGTIQFGLVFLRYQGLQAAAREGARVASLSQSTQADIQGRVLSALQGIPLDGAPQIVVSPSQPRPCNFRTGQPVSVAVTAPTVVEIPLFGTQTLNIQGRGEFRCE